MVVALSCLLLAVSVGGRRARENDPPHSEVSHKRVIIRGRFEIKEISIRQKVSNHLPPTRHVMAVDVDGIER